MATIKPIEGRSVHQIQSGQVIVDLNSVVKELVENSLDAHATSIEIRFKNNGLDSIEVQDNGSGIGPDDFESLALKHHTSKLSSYADLGKLNTFGFRGEALSSLCALSTFYVTTARECDKPKGTKLEFEISGKVKSKSVVAGQKGTTVTVENIFKNLPVRRKELERNIKREYQKVLNLLNAYACISTDVRFIVSNSPTKGKKNVVFSTQGNASTRENIANVFSAKALSSLLALDLKFDLNPSTLPSQSARTWSTQNDVVSREIQLVGHISRPVVGEGRQAPDRQMFFVNSRPCALPQLAKAINEAYRAYNFTQSPFIFANLIMDTNSYDVNVSPDKRTILLHDQTALLEALKTNLTELFEAHDQSVPQSQLLNSKLPAYKPLTVNRDTPVRAVSGPTIEESAIEKQRFTALSDPPTSSDDANMLPPGSLMRKFIGRGTVDRGTVDAAPKKKEAITRESLPVDDPNEELPEVTEEEPAKGKGLASLKMPPPESLSIDDSISTPTQSIGPVPKRVQEFNRAFETINKIHSDATKSSEPESLPHKSLPISAVDEATVTGTPTGSRTRDAEDPIPSTTPGSRPRDSGGISSSFKRFRQPRDQNETVTVTIGDVTTVSTLGSPVSSKRRKISTPASGSPKSAQSAKPILLKSLRSFAAPGSQMANVSMDEMDLEAAVQSQKRKEKRDKTSSSLNTDDLIDSDQELPARFDEITAPELTEADDDDQTEASEDVEAGAPAELQDPESDSDGEYVDEAEKKRREDAKVARMIAEAEEQAARPTADNLKRAASMLGSKVRRDATVHLQHTLDTTPSKIEDQMQTLRTRLDKAAAASNHAKSLEDVEADSVEERLSLTVAKEDFSRMRITGQFNRGFIIAVRPPDQSAAKTSTWVAGRSSDEVFIVDQHASDEKYNFERLQATTVVQNQPLVRPKRLDLTALEEEIIINNPEAFSKNGFTIEVDLSGDHPVGRRCQLISLPMSKEVVFDSRDLEELVALLSDHAGSSVPRPSKVRRMFAMRACRSSVMVGRTMTPKQMDTIVRHMGEIDKPWNCPHGRPTMRHLTTLNSWQGWSEGDGLASMEEKPLGSVQWTRFATEFYAESSDAGEELSGEDDR
ncbi:DNA mismatch repair protein MutL [Microthyrium microscopicum]|uniref:DNA mismatch repair protein PMS1 n=1 Tax=Microthyrium microscopicum TaxID=703497 RepID=A0A6A6U8T9_9PEZI|nr:DNA mismatch repair protein MutL [Microthyrium microscopicum]